MKLLGFAPLPSSPTPAFLFVNPELMRSFWQEFSVGRLLIVPIMFALLLIGNTEFIFPLALVTSLFLYAPIRIFQALKTEFTTHTWDWQRLSSQSPARLLAGKLIGAPLFAWYIAFWATVGVLIEGTPNKIVTYLGRNSIPVIWLTAVAICATAILLSLLSASTGQVAKRSRAWPLILLFIIFQLISVGTSVFGLSGSVPLTWYRLSANPILITYSFTLLWLGWALIGAHRVLRRELSYQNGPEWWIAFLAFLLFFFEGFVPTINVTNNFLTKPDIPEYKYYVGLLIPALLLVVTYFSAMLDLKSIRNYNALLQGFKEITSPRMLAIIPLWIWSLLAVFVSIFLSLILGRLNAASLSFGLALLLFSLRDIGVLYLFWLRRDNRRANAGWLLYLALAYFILPSVSGVVLPEQVYISLFYPNPKNGLVAFLPPLIMVTCVAFLLYRATLALVQNRLSVSERRVAS
jgi:hypothetical protein